MGVRGPSAAPACGERRLLDAGGALTCRFWVEVRGFEPLASSVRVRTRSPLCHQRFPGRCGPVGVVRRSAAMASSPGQHRSPGHPVDAAVIDQGVCSSVTSGGRGLGGPGRGRPPASGRTETAGMGSRHAGDVVGVLQGPAAPTRLPEQDRLEGAFLPHSCNSRTVESALSTNADVPRQTGSRMLDDQAVLTFFQHLDLVLSQALRGDEQQRLRRLTRTAGRCVGDNCHFFCSLWFRWVWPGQVGQRFW